MVRKTNTPTKKNANAPEDGPSVAEQLDAIGNEADAAEAEAHRLDLKLLELLPLPELSRIASLPLGAHTVLDEKDGRAFVFLRGAPLFFAAGSVPATPAERDAELGKLLAVCQRGSGERLFTLSDFRAEVRRRRGLN